MSDVVERLQAEVANLRAALRGEHGIIFEDGTIVNVAELRAEIERLRIDVGECRLVIEQQDRDIERLRAELELERRKDHRWNAYTQGFEDGDAYARRRALGGEE